MMFRYHLLQMLITVCITITALGAEAINTNMTHTEAELLSQVMAAWKERQTRVRTFEFTWERPPENASLQQSYQEMVAPVSNAFQKFSWNSLKANETAIRYETYRWFFYPLMEYSGLVVHDRKEGHPETYDPYLRLHFHNRPHYFHDFKTATFSGFRGGPAQSRDPRRLTSLIQNGVRTECFAKGAEQYDQYRILKRVANTGSLIELSEELYYLPLLLLYRPFESDAGQARINRFQIVDDHSSVDGFDCVVLEESHESGMTRRFWVDASRDYCIVRFLASAPGFTPVQLDLQYRQDPDQGWVPRKWTSMLFTQKPLFAGHALLPQVAVAKVTAFRINPALPESDFASLPIARGAFVTDERTDEHFIDLGNGRRRTITREEIIVPRVNYDSLIQSGANPFADSPLSLLGSWRLWILLAFGLGSVFLLTRQRRVSRILNPPHVAGISDHSHPSTMANPPTKDSSLPL